MPSPFRAGETGGRTPSPDIHAAAPLTARLHSWRRDPGWRRRRRDHGAPNGFRTERGGTGGPAPAAMSRPEGRPWPRSGRTGASRTALRARPKHVTGRRGGRRRRVRLHRRGARARRGCRDHGLRKLRQERPARAGRHPGTGERSAIGPSTGVSFKAGKVLKDALNRQRADGVHGGRSASGPGSEVHGHPGTFAQRIHLRPGFRRSAVTIRWRSGKASLPPRFGCRHGVAFATLG